MGIGGQAILKNQQLAFRKDFRAEMHTLARQLRTILIDAAGEDGELTFSEFNAVQSRASNVVMRFFVGANGQAFTEQGEALAPFGELLNRHYAQVVYLAVKAHHDWLVKFVPQDLQQKMLASVVRSPAILPPQAVAALILAKAAKQQASREMRVGELTDEEAAKALLGLPATNRFTDEELSQLRIFRPNPLAEIDPERLWVGIHEPRQIINDFGDVRPYYLSDAVWQAGDATRQKVHEVIRLGISQGRSAVDIARDLEKYLLPDLVGNRTFNPYGVQWLGPEGVASAAMRIARTEMSYAFNQATYTAALHNPWVDRVAWVLSGAHPAMDICDQLAGIYELSVAKIPPAHPYCLCHSESLVKEGAEDIQAIAEQIRTELEAMRNELFAPVMTPLMLDDFVAGLIQRHLLNFTGIPVGYVPSSIVVPF